MSENDTVKLLLECDTGVKMAISAIDDVMDKTGNEALRHLLTQSRREHDSLGAEIGEQLSQSGAQNKTNLQTARLMSQLKSGIKIGMSAQTDRAIAEFVTDGCNMGIKTLCKGMNRFKNAGTGAKQACGRLVNLEDKLSSELRLYL